MPRNGSGTFTLVSGNPVVTGTTIESNWANTTLSDIATTLTDSLSRSGQGGMTAALRVADGTQGAPGVGFANETGSGFYRAGTGEVWAVVQGAQTLNLDASGVYVPADKTTTVDGAFVFNEAGADKDARFEGDTDANLLFTDASTDRVGVGTNAPLTKMTVRGATQSQEVALRWERATDGAVAGGLGYFYDSENSVAVGSVTNHPLKLIVNDTTGATLDTSGNLGLGVTPSAWGSNFRSLDVLSFGASVASSSAGNTLTSVAHNAYNDNTNWRYRASNIGAARYEMTGANAGSTHAWYVSAGGTAGNAISFTQAMTLDASGNLGVGPTSPSAKLHVGTQSGGVAAPTQLRLDTSYASTATPTNQQLKLALAYISATEAYGFALDNLSGIWYHSGNTTGPTGSHIFATGGTERARITSGGDLLVGTTDSSAISGTGFKVSSGTRPICVRPESTNAQSVWDVYSTGAAAYRFYVALDGTIYATSTTISAISDQRLKENVRDLDDGLGAIMALKPRKFDWKAGKGKDIKDDRGFIAQEFEQVFPDLIDEWKDPAPEGEEPYKSVRQDLIPVLVKAIQEQQAIIEDLRARVQALEAQP